MAINIDTRGFSGYTPFRDQFESSGALSPGLSYLAPKGAAIVRRGIGPEGSSTSQGTVTRSSGEDRRVYSILGPLFAQTQPGDLNSPEFTNKLRQVITANKLTPQAIERILPNLTATSMKNRRSTLMGDLMGFVKWGATTASMVLPFVGASGGFSGLGEMIGLGSNMTLPPGVDATFGAAGGVGSGASGLSFGIPELAAGATLAAPASSAIGTLAANIQNNPLYKAYEAASPTLEAINTATKPLQEMYKDYGASKTVSEGAGVGAGLGSILAAGQLTGTPTTIAPKPTSPVTSAVQTPIFANTLKRQTAALKYGSTISTPKPIDTRGGWLQHYIRGAETR